MHKILRFLLDNPERGITELFAVQEEVSDNRDPKWMFWDQLSINLI